MQQRDASVTRVTRVTRKRVTVLFADILGFSAIADRMGTEPAYAAVTGCLRLLDAAARRHRGAVDKYMGDSLMVLFGGLDDLPGAEAGALEAALEMREMVHAYRTEVPGGEDLDVQIGINTGFATIGDVGSSVVREFAVMGDAVNVAARLEAKAGPGAIYVGQLTRDAAAEDFAFDPIAPLALKGKSQPVPAFALSGIRARGDAALRVPPGLSDSGPLRGREDLLQQLREAASGLDAGQGAALWIAGAAGLGKTRLAAELDRVTERAILYCSPVGLDSAPDFRSFAALARFGPFDGPVPLDPEALFSAIFDTAFREPLALVFDDLERSDTASLALLARLAASIREDGLPLLLLALSRGGPPDTFASGAAGAVLGRIELDSIDGDAARALILDVDPSRELAPEDVELVLRRADGNPATLLRAPALVDALRADAARADQVEDRSSAERRRATVLFADLSGFTAMSERTDPAIAYDLVTDCLSRLDDVALRWGGTVEKHLGDCVLALFGVPHAIEDAPRAAINAAIEMRNAVERFNEERELEMPLSIHIGIETGTNISADISGPLIREYALMGDSVGAASALTDAAGSWQVFVGENTCAETKRQFKLEERESVAASGTRGAVRAFELQSSEVRRHRARGRAGRIFSSFVGREAELATGARAFSDLREGNGNVLGVVAEAGLGKSRLLEELRSSATLPESSGPDLRWIEARSLSNGSSMRYHPFADALLGWLELSPDAEEAAILRALDSGLAALLGERADAVAASMRRVLGLAGDERGGGDAMSKVMLKDFTVWLRALADERPTVIVFEDLHWADLSSIDLLEPLLRLSADHALLFLLMYRPEYPETSGHIDAHVSSNLDRARMLRLTPLDRDGARALVRNLFGGAEVPRRLRNTLVERAAGNPFFLEEAVRSLVDHGALEIVGETLVPTAAIEDAEIPGTIQEVIMSRLDRLDREKRAFLQVAAIMGVGFFLRVVEEVLSKEGSTRITDALVEAELLSHVDDVAGVEFEFKHPLTQEVTYDSMLEEQRRQLHAEVGSAMETVLTDNVPGYHAMLAFHFGRGGATERAEPHLFAAGEEAARSAASNEALKFFREASDLYADLNGSGGDPVKLGQLEANLGVALLNRGQLGESIEHFDRSLAFGGLREPTGTAGRIARLAVDLPLVLWRLYVPLPWGGGRRASDEERTRFDLMFRRAIAQSTSDPTRFLMDSLSNLRRVEGVDPRSVPEAAAFYAGAVGIFSFGAGLYGVGQRLLHIADGLAEQGCIDERELYYRVLRFLHYSWFGDWADANCVPDEMLQRGLAEGRLWEVSTYLDIETDRRIRRGEFALAEERLNQLTEVADSYQHELAWSAVRAQRTFLALERRDLDAAAHSVEAYYEEHADVPINLYGLGERAKIEILQERWVEAEQTLERCRSLRKTGGRIAAFHGITHARSELLYGVARAEAARAVGDAELSRQSMRAARRALRPAISAARGIASRRPEVYRLVGRFYFLKGRSGAAAKWWSRSLESARSMGARPEEGRLLAEVASRRGVVLPGFDAASCAREAAAIFEELSLDSDQKRLLGGEVP